MLGSVRRESGDRGERPFGKGFTSHAFEQSVMDTKAVLGERIKNISQKLQQGSGGASRQN